MILELESHCEHFSGSDILSTSWMQDQTHSSIGWLACGNKTGSVSITKTLVESDLEIETSANDLSPKSNYNLRNSKVPINIVEWNPFHKKLATCSNTGSILVYHNVNNQWSIDLVNERAHAVEVFKWSRSSNQVMIGYTDGLLIVGSVSGHRLWHRMMDMHSVLNQSSGFNIPTRPPNQHPLPRSDNDTDNSNLNLFENVLRNNSEDTLMVSRNYRRTSDISTFYHADSINRSRYFNTQQSYRPVLDETYPRMETNPSTNNGSSFANPSLLNRHNNNSQRKITDDQPSSSHFEDMPTLTCGTWSPNDITITVATSIGSLLSFPYAWERLPLRLVRQRDRLLRLNDSILQIEWSCPPFRRNESSGAGLPNQEPKYYLNNNINFPQNSFPDSEMSLFDSMSGTDFENQLFDNSENFILAVAFSSGYIYLLRHLEDIDPTKIQTGLSRLCISWNSTGTVLAVGGFVRSANLECQCSVKLFSTTAEVIYFVPVPSMNKPIMSVTWGHEDTRLFVSASICVHTFRVRNCLSSLTQNCCQIIRNSLKFRQESVDKLCLPLYLHNKIHNAFRKTIQGIIPLPFRLKEFVLLPKQETIHCVFQKVSPGNGLTKYILFLEFLGASIPLLMASRSRSVKYEYLIYDPTLKQLVDSDPLFPHDEVEAEHCNCTSQCNWQRKFKHQNRKKQQNLGRNAVCILPDSDSKYSEFVRAEFWKKEHQTDCKRCRISELMTNDDMPEISLLAKLKSNVTLTKFELTSCQICLPRVLSRINFGVNIKINPLNGVSVQLVEISDSTGLKMANYYRDHCLNLQGLSVSCYADNSFQSDIQFFPYTQISKSNRSIDSPILRKNRHPQLIINDPNSASSSCYSSPTHWCYIKQTNNKSPLSRIKSLPTTPKKVDLNVSKRMRLSHFQNNFRNSQIPAVPSFRTFFISNEQSDSKHDIYIRSSKRIILKYDNDQILDFYRLENDKYSLEFKYPFSPLQAFGVGIANISRLFR